MPQAKVKSEVADNSNPQLEPIEGSPSGKVMAETNRITLEGQFSVEKVGDLWWLRSLSRHEVEINGIPAMEVLLEGGEQIVSGNYRYRFTPSSDQPGNERESGRRIPWLESVLLILVVLAVVAWKRQPDPSKQAVLVQPPKVQTAPWLLLPKNRDDAIVQARLLLNQCQFYIREYQSNDTYLHRAILELEDLNAQLEEMGPPADLEQKLEATLQNGQTTLKAELNRLKNNAIIADEAGQSKEYSEILNKMRRMIHDPMDPIYQWALNRGGD